MSSRIDGDGLRRGLKRVPDLVKAEVRGVAATAAKGVPQPVPARLRAMLVTAVNAALRRGAKAP